MKERRECTQKRAETREMINHIHLVNSLSLSRDQPFSTERTKGNTDRRCRRIYEDTSETLCREALSISFSGASPLRLSNHSQIIEHIYAISAEQPNRGWKLLDVCLRPSENVRTKSSSHEEERSKSTGHTSTEVPFAAGFLPLKYINTTLTLRSL